MSRILAMLLAAPALTVALYIFTRLFEIVMRPSVHPAVKALGGITMLCALITAGLAITGARELGEVIAALAQSTAPRE